MATEESAKPLLEVKNRKVIFDLHNLNADSGKNIDTIFNIMESLMEVSGN